MFFVLLVQNDVKHDIVLSSIEMRCFAMVFIMSWKTSACDFLIQLKCFRCTYPRVYVYNNKTLKLIQIIMFNTPIV